MTWVRIDDQFTDHPKLVAAGPVAGWVHVSGMCYASRYLTNGFVPENIALRFAGSSPEVLANLVECSLWHRVNGGYQIHDYLDYNPTADKVKQEREAAKARMQANRPTKQARSPELRPNFARTSPELQASPSPSPSPSERDERDGRPPTTPPPDPFPSNDPEWGAAITKLESAGIGGMTGAALLELSALWPDLTNGKRSWLDDAILVAIANSAKSPTYAIRVLAGAVHEGRRPGTAPVRKPKGGRVLAGQSGRSIAEIIGLTAAEEEERNGITNDRFAAA